MISGTPAEASAEPAMRSIRPHLGAIGERGVHGEVRDDIGRRSRRR